MGSNFLPNRAAPLLNLALAYKKGTEVEAATAYQRASQLSQKLPDLTVL